MRISTISAAAAIFAIVGIASAQQTESPAAMTALTSSQDTTIARRVLMDAIGFNNDALHDMLDGVTPWDGYEFRHRTMTLNAMLKAFPSLYRAEPNPWTEAGEAAEPARVSLALPTVWEDFATFEALSYEAAAVAQQASFVGQDEALVFVEELEAVCEACHATFRKSFEDFVGFDDLPYPATP